MSNTCPMFSTTPPPMEDEWEDDDFGDFSAYPGNTNQCVSYTSDESSSRETSPPKLPTEMWSTIPNYPQGSPDKVCQRAHKQNSEMTLGKNAWSEIKDGGVNSSAYKEEPAISSSSDNNDFSAFTENENITKNGNSIQGVIEDSKDNDGLVPGHSSSFHDTVATSQELLFNDAEVSSGIEMQDKDPEMALCMQTDNKVSEHLQVGSSSNAFTGVHEEFASFESAFMSSNIDTVAMEGSDCSELSSSGVDEYVSGNRSEIDYESVNQDVGGLQKDLPKTLPPTSLDEEETSQSADHQNLPDTEVHADTCSSDVNLQDTGLNSVTCTTYINKVQDTGLHADTCTSDVNVQDTVLSTVTCTTDINKVLKVLHGDTSTSDVNIQDTGLNTDTSTNDVNIQDTGLNTDTFSSDVNIQDTGLNTDTFTSDVCIVQDSLAIVIGKNTSDMKIRDTGLHSDTGSGDVKIQEYTNGAPCDSSQDQHSSVVSIIQGLPSTMYCDMPFDHNFDDHSVKEVIMGEEQQMSAAVSVVQTTIDDPTNNMKQQCTVDAANIIFPIEHCSAVKLVSEASESLPRNEGSLIFRQSTTDETEQEGCDDELTGPFDHSNWKASEDDFDDFSRAPTLERAGIMNTARDAATTNENMDERTNHTLTVQTSAKVVNYEASDDEFSDFAQANVQSSDTVSNDGVSNDVVDEDEDEFADFAIAPVLPPHTEAIPSSQANADDDDDGFADFTSAFTATSPSSQPEEPVEDQSCGKPTHDLGAMSGGDHFADFSQASSRASPVDEDSALNRTGSSEQSKVMNSIQLVLKPCFTQQPVVTGQSEAWHLVEQMAQNLSEEQINGHQGLKIWHELNELEDTSALKHTWSGSLSYGKLLKSVNIDVSNMLVGNKKKSTPVFATGLGMLEPTKPSVTLISKDEPPPPIAAQEIPPATFDWAGSGLTNPLHSSTLDEDMMSTLNIVPMKGPPPPTTFNNILQSYSTPSVKVMELSSEAELTLKKLPNLNYMLAKVLMFPIKQMNT